MIRISIAIATLLASCAALAQTSPIGLWKSFDEQTGKPKALIRIAETNGEFKGKIEKVFSPNGEEEQDRKCVKCEGIEKDQPIVGMTILTGLKQDGDEYNGGHILDPANGKTYNSKMTLVEGGKKLSVRGYVMGMSFLGRSQTWTREE